MEKTMNMASPTDPNWWLFTLPAVLTTDALVSSLPLLLTLLLALFSAVLITWTLSSAGPAWPSSRSRLGPVPIPGVRGLPLLGSLLTLSRGLPHRALAALARSSAATHLMAFSVANTPAVVASDPAIAKEILTHPSFADRPIKTSARELMFSRAIGFAPSGAYWRQLRRIASTHLFSPRRVAAHEPGRQTDCSTMLAAIANEMRTTGSVLLRPHLQAAALDNIMGSVFGRRYDMASAEAAELQALVREGFELLGAFNWSDHLPCLANIYDPSHVKERCAVLVPRVKRLVKRIIHEHEDARSVGSTGDNGDFVDVLLSIDGDEKLSEDDMIAVLWEMIFRGTDTTALLTEWIMAELVLHPRVQNRLRAELDASTGTLADTDIAKLPYLTAVIKESLRAHPPGPLLSWARLSTSDVALSNGMVVPSGTTAMVNMWAITHDAGIWAAPEDFKPERFMVKEGGVEVDVRGGDLRLAPFGAGRRVCPGMRLGMATVTLWVARLVKGFEWSEGEKVDLTELLKLSCEMKTALTAVAVPKDGVNVADTVF